MGNIFERFFFVYMFEEFSSKTEQEGDNLNIYVLNILSTFSSLPNLLVIQNRMKMEI